MYTLFGGFGTASGVARQTKALARFRVKEEEDRWLEMHMLEGESTSWQAR